MWICRRLERLGVHVILWFALRELDDQRGHGHLNVEFNHVYDRVKLDVHDGIFKKHKANQQSLRK